MSSRRKFMYRGKSLEELLSLSLAEVAQLMPARRRRSIMRPSFWTPERKKLRDKLKVAAELGRAGKNPRAVRTHVRVMPILPEMIGAIAEVHNGKEYLRVQISPEMVGFLIGEFAPTRKIVRHGSPGIGATRSSTYVPLK